MNITGPELHLAFPSDTSLCPVVSSDTLIEPTWTGTGWGTLTWTYDGSYGTGQDFKCIVTYQATETGSVRVDYTVDHVTIFTALTSNSTGLATDLPWTLAASSGFTMSASHAVTITAKLDAGDEQMYLRNIDIFPV